MREITGQNAAHMLLAEAPHCAIPLAQVPHSSTRPGVRALADCAGVRRPHAVRGFAHGRRIVQTSFIGLPVESDRIVMWS